MDKGIFSALKAPFPTNAIHWRIGARNKDKTKGMPLAYIDARDVMDRLDNVVGGGHWFDHYSETPSGRILCRLTIDIPGIGQVTKSDGAGDTGTEGEKGAISDALKRAAVKFGVGRYLYGLGSQWVDIDQYGKFTPPALPKWATPKGYELSLSRKMNRISVQQALIACLRHLENEDMLGMKEVMEELSEEEQHFLWRIFDTNQKELVRKLLNEAVTNGQ